MFFPLFFPVSGYEETWREGPNFVKLAGLLAGVCFLFFFLVGFWLFSWFDLFFGLGVFQERHDRQKRERYNPQTSFYKHLGEYL